MKMTNSEELNPKTIFEKSIRYDVFRTDIRIVPQICATITVKSTAAGWYFYNCNCRLQLYGVIIATLQRRKKDIMD